MIEKLTKVRQKKIRNNNNYNNNNNNSYKNHSGNVV